MAQQSSLLPSLDDGELLQDIIESAQFPFPEGFDAALQCPTKRLLSDFCSDKLRCLTTAFLGLHKAIKELHSSLKNNLTLVADCRKQLLELAAAKALKRNRTRLLRTEEKEYKVLFGGDEVCAPFAKGSEQTEAGQNAKTFSLAHDYARIVLPFLLKAYLNIDDKKPVEEEVDMMVIAEAIGVLEKVLHFHVKLYKLHQEIATAYSSGKQKNIGRKRIEKLRDMLEFEEGIQQDAHESFTLLTTALGVAEGTGKLLHVTEWQSIEGPPESGTEVIVDPISNFGVSTTKGKSTKLLALLKEYVFCKVHKAPRKGKNGKEIDRGHEYREVIDADTGEKQMLYCKADAQTFLLVAPTYLAIFIKRFLGVPVKSQGRVIFEDTLDLSAFQ
uniref:Uncharacterized protein n=1 Tax=Chromera velia CCMP2878 TaxID=1169474 RepID=A0A0G4I6U5_9ALVE|eukprot:Cvel_11434.t1-p1 / transcript=Cvel_11434.t1 / gene=Cvel_11434 / organism=Chromera_velia_CCMP2878 / gene_product=hypothetical protein / transcript_product=hypothetical protein / location=Cvel_scaffold719:18232-19860(-) / protein_length=385 / sequence_SO=supercontig / SO=protein_coding / is_pseudo=false